MNNCIKLLFLVSALVAAGCGGSSKAPRTGPPAKPRPTVTAPTKVSAETYPGLRERYDALSPETIGRAAFRDKLLVHLAAEAESRWKGGSEQRAYDRFRKVLGLFDPAEVYAGGLKQARVRKLAKKLFGRHAPRGDEAVALPTLAVLQTLSPGDATIPADFSRIEAWTVEAMAQQFGPVLAERNLIRLLEETVRLWPSEFVVKRLRRRYIAQSRHLDRRRQRGSTLGAQARFLDAMVNGKKLARLFLRVGRPARALDAVRELNSTYEHDRAIAGLLSAVVNRKAEVSDYLKLAGLLRDRDLAVGFVLCRRAATEYPKNAVAHACVAHLARETDRPELAEVHLRRAVSLAPGQRTFAADLVTLYRDRVFKMVGEDRTDEARAKLEQAKAFLARVEKRFGNSVGEPLGQLYMAVGHAYFNRGGVERAAEAFRRSLALDQNPEAAAMLSTIQIHSGKPLEALGTLRRTEQSPSFRAIVPRQKAYWEARFWLLRARALAGSGDREQSARAHGSAVRMWQVYRQLNPGGDSLAESFVLEARSLYALGQKGKALDAMDRAIDAQPERKETYADVIALLTTYGHLPEALDALHRALGREEVTEYLKSYCSFWIVGLSRRAGAEVDPRVKDYLTRLGGKKWYTRLSRLVLGKVGFEQLQKEARTVGNRAELFYYWADSLAAQGKLDAAKEMWKKVLGTGMMAFYEYEKAVYHLRNGLSQVSTRRLDRKKE